MYTVSDIIQGYQHILGILYPSLKGYSDITTPFEGLSRARASKASRLLISERFMRSPTHCFWRCETAQIGSFDRNIRHRWEVYSFQMRLSTLLLRALVTQRPKSMLRKLTLAQLSSCNAQWRSYIEWADWHTSNYSSVQWSGIESKFRRSKRSRVMKPTLRYLAWSGRSVSVSCGTFRGQT